MKVAIVGSSGYIAGFLNERLKKIESIEKILEIDQTAEAEVHLNLEQPGMFDYSKLDDIDYVIFTAAVSGPDKCAAEFDCCWNINVTGTAWFVEEAIKRHCKVLFFSSDAVYGDEPGKIYDELSATGALTPYGRMKKAIEDQFQNRPLFKAIRLSYVASARDRFVSYCLQCVRTGETAEIFHPFYRNCTTLSDVAQVVTWLLIHWDEYEPFVLNVAGRELVSRVRIADEINRFTNGKLSYQIIKPDDGFYRNRPPITQVKSLYLNQFDILQESTFTEKIKMELEEQ